MASLKVLNWFQASSALLFLPLCPGPPWRAAQSSERVQGFGLRVGLRGYRMVVLGDVVVPKRGRVQYGYRPRNTTILVNEDHQKVSKILAKPAHVRIVEDKKGHACTI